MLLRERFEAQGSVLFRWRSFLPFVALPLAIAALPQSGWLDATLGEHVEAGWDVFCVVVALLGQTLRVFAVGFVPAGTSGRNTSEQRATRLNTTGLYSIVRNPIYLGNLIVLAGFALATKVWWVPLVVMPVAVVYYERIVFTEEAFLLEKFGNTYRQWVARTPALLPRLRNWVAPDLAFSLRTAIRREYHGYFLIAVVMTLIEFLSDVIGEREALVTWFTDEGGWIAFFAVSLFAYVAIRTVRKHTNWLAVAGR